MGYHCPLQGIFPSLGSNLCLLHGRWILYHWAIRRVTTNNVPADCLRHLKDPCPLAPIPCVISPHSPLRPTAWEKVTVFPFLRSGDKQTMVSILSASVLSLEKEMATHSSTLAWKILSLNHLLWENPCPSGRILVRLHGSLMPTARWVKLEAVSSIPDKKICVNVLSFFLYTDHLLWISFYFLYFWLCHVACGIWVHDKGLNPCSPD